MLHLSDKDCNELNTTKKVNPDALDFGLFILQTKIHLFEAILHLPLKLSIYYIAIIQTRTITYSLIANN